MKTFLSLYLLAAFAFANNSYAEVWRATHDWNQHWENEYQNWIKKSLTRKIFKTEGDLLYGLSTDCADALYAFRIKFAYENSLPFQMHAPDVLQSKMKFFGNNTNMFDSISDERKRVRAFINYVSDEAGVANLIKDTFPVQIKKIDAGILYLVEWQLLGMGKINHHSYILKGTNSDNELIYYYSDAPRKVRTLEENEGYPRFKFDTPPYGFRRWKQPQHLLISEKEISAEDGYSREQYEVLNRVGKKEVLREIDRIRRSN